MWIGIIAEWQPLHRGHARLISTAKDHWPGAGLLALLSGPFDQRGRPCLWDKWTRTEMALAQGVDLVLELPQYAATSSLEGFARGGAELLMAAGVEAIAFGSESGDEEGLRRQGALLRAPSKDLQEGLKDRLKAGMAYGPALQKSLAEQSPGPATQRTAANDRLNAQYLAHLSADIQVLALKRGSELSGTQIRQGLAQAQDLSRHLPASTVALLEQRPELEAERLYQAARLLALGLGAQALAELWSLNDGSEHRFERAFQEAVSLKGFLLLAQDRHYSRARLRRMILQLLAPLPPKKPGPPPYLRVLGARRLGRLFLRERLHAAEVPVLVNPGRDQAQLNQDQRSHFEGDLRRQNLWQGLVKGQGAGVYDRDFRQAPIFQA